MNVRIWRLFLCAFAGGIVALTCSSWQVSRAGDGSPLHGTQPLTIEGDIASVLVDGS